MKANELRIGNYVNYWYSALHKKTTRQITALRREKYMISGTISEFNYDYRLVKPIPLTEDWLLKFGYKTTKIHHYAIKGHLIWIINGNFICDKNGVTIKHVHQLQNLYFALTGTELEITENETSKP